MARTARIMAEAFAKALVDAGVITQDLDSIHRIVIDAKAGHAVMFYLECHGDERLLGVAQTLDGIEISSALAGG